MRIRLVIIMHVVLVYLLPAACVQQAWSQTDDECKALVQRAYDKFNAYGELPAAGQMCSVEYSQYTHMRDSVRYHNSAVSVKMKASTDKTWYSNGDVEWFQDETHSVVIIGGRNTVYLRDSDFRSAESRNVMMQKLLQSYDTLFATAVVESCVQLDINGRPVRQVTMNMSDNVRSKTDIRNIVYTVDVQNETVYSIHMEYAGKSTVAAVTAEFHRLEYGVEEEPFEGDVYELFFTGDGRLKEPYVDYRLIDVRAKASNE